MKKCCANKRLIVKEIVKYEKSAIQKKCNDERLQHEESTAWEKCNSKRVQDEKCST